MSSRTTTLQLLTKFVQQFSDRVKSNFNDSGSLGGAEDDIVIDDTPEDENDEAKKKSDDQVYTVLANCVSPLAKVICH